MLDELQAQLEMSKELVAVKDAINRLYYNKDFQRVVNDLFFKEECSRYAQASGDARLSKEQREDALAMAQSAGHLKRWLSLQCQMGITAENDIVVIKEQLEALLNGEQ